MITANQKKIVKSLTQKKFRSQYQAFVVEGVKLVEEALKSDYLVKVVYALPEWTAHHPEVDVITVSEKELSAMSSLKTPNEVLAVVEMPAEEKIAINAISISIALDKIQDPGNLGTIIRTADWFGINQVICSADSVDVYNSKVIQATMGSLFRVKVVYTDLEDYLKNNLQLNVYGAFIEGDNVYQTRIKQEKTILLMGNESNGISSNLLPYIDEKISIPGYGTAESLNVAVATGIICSECKRG